MAASGRIDSSGSTPSVNVDAVASTFITTLMWGWWTGVIGFGRRLAGGVWSTFDKIGAFLGSDGGVIMSLFGIPGSAFDAAARENAAFLASLGVWAQPVAVVEGVVILYGLLWVLETAFRRVRTSI